MTHHFALTGGIATGKSTVSEWFEANTPWAIIDADLVSHKLTARNGAAIDLISDSFGNNVIHNGALNRSAMRALVFNDPAARKKLEAILHPLIRNTMESVRQQASSTITISVIPLLTETKQARLFERVISVDCADNIQLARLVNRPGINSVIAKKIIHAQT